MSPHYTLEGILMSVFKIFLLNMLHHLYAVFSHSQRLPQFSFLSFFYYLLRYLFESFQSLLVFSSSYFQSIMKQREIHEYENTKFACCTLVVIYYCTAGTYVHSLGSMKFVLGTFCQRMELIDSSTFWVTPGKHSDNNSNDARRLV